MSDSFDLDALEVEGEDFPPFVFTYKGESYEMPVTSAMPWQAQTALETATQAQSLRLILGDEQYDRLSKQPMSAARMGALVDQWGKYQGLALGE